MLSATSENLSSAVRVDSAGRVGSAGHKSSKENKASNKNKERIQTIHDLIDQTYQVSVPITSIPLPFAQGQLGSSVDWDLLRLDCFHPVVSGNKWFKLLPFLLQAHEQQSPLLISFGGRHSNHLHALAYMANLLDFSLVVVVRGYVEQPMTWTLNQVASLGGEIFYVGHEEYKHRHDLEHWQQHSELAQFVSSYQLPGITEATWIGEGGRIMDSDLDRDVDRNIDRNMDNTAEQDISIKLLEAVIHNSLKQADKEPHSYQMLTAAAGSGSFAGLLSRLITENFPEADLCITLAVNDESVVQQLSPFSQCLLAQRKGFGKIDEQLVEFISQFYQQTKVLLDPVYNAKQIMILAQAHQAIENLRQKRIQQAQSEIRSVLSIHSGGLQGFMGCFNHTLFKQAGLACSEFQSALLSLEEEMSA